VSLALGGLAYSPLDWAWRASDVDPMVALREVRPPALPPLPRNCLSSAQLPAFFVEGHEDPRLAFRVLARTPFVTTIAILSLGLSGANTAIFRSLTSSSCGSWTPDSSRLVNLGTSPKSGSVSCGDAKGRATGSSAIRCSATSSGSKRP
jgi:hypothetical protein